MKPIAKLLAKVFPALLLCLSVNAFSQSSPKPVEVFSKDGISVKSYDFKSFEAFLQQPNDTTYVINFWATWCGPCVAELPNFEKLNQSFKGKKAKVLLVSLDFKKQVEKSLLPFIKKKNLQSECVLLSDPDMNSWIPKVSPEWSGALPATVIYNSAKNVRKFYERSFTLKQLESEVKPYIQ